MNELILQFRENYWKILKPHVLPLSLACIGLILIGYGVISLLSPQKQADDITFEAASNAAQEVSIYVDVAGAVMKPGVYKLASSSRMQDALIAAGGLSSLADRKWVSKTINLARKVEDGAKIYIPTKGEINTTNTTNNTNSTIQVAGDSISGKININAATQAQLEGLPGIGPVTAQKIIAGRPYGSIEDLKTKKVISAKVFDKIKDLVETY